MRVALRRRLNELLPGEQATNLPYLANLFGLHLSDEESRQLNGLGGETLKHQVMLVIISYFAALAEKQPLALVFEDLHWADVSTLEVLELLLPLTDRLPLLLLFLARIDHNHGSWRLKLHAETDFAHRYTELQLQPLSDPKRST
jgi:predicted ATPase